MSLLGHPETGKPLLQNFTNEEVPLCATFVPLGAKILSQLLKVVETPFWAQNDRNTRVYISTYNNSKL